MDIRKVIESFPEPFKSATKVKGFSFDYRLNEGKNDHKYLKAQGYSLSMGEDCAYYVKGLRNLNATSYGEWGTIFSDLFEEEKIDGYNKSFHEFCKMYESGIIKLWRIIFSKDNINYAYTQNTDVNGEWLKYENHEWKKCDNPLD